jgi:hypothetical protein
MKSVSAFLFSLLLIVAQAAFIAGAADSAVTQRGAESCCGDHCQKRCCFSDQGAPAPSSPPATPTRTVSRTDWQAPATALAVLDHRAIGTALLVRPDFTPSVTAVPLYQRNCSYLI